MAAPHCFFPQHSGTLFFSSPFHDNPLPIPAAFPSLPSDPDTSSRAELTSGSPLNTHEEFNLVFFSPFLNSEFLDSVPRVVPPHNTASSLSSSFPLRGLHPHPILFLREKKSVSRSRTFRGSALSKVFDVPTSCLCQFSSLALPSPPVLPPLSPSCPLRL